MKQIIGLGLLCAGFACAEYVSAPIMAYLPDEVNLTDGAYAYAPATVYYNGVFHQFYCSRGGFTDHFFYHPDDDKGKREIINPQDEKYKGKTLPDEVDGVKIDKDGYRLEHGFIQSHDHIRYRTSKNGTTWSPARIVMTQTRYEYKKRQHCACDPAIIKDGDYWYLYYQGAIGSRNGDLYDGATYVSRSKSIGGPYLTLTTDNKWERWPKNPKPILRKGVSNGYGVGQLSVVKGGIDSKYHFWAAEHFWTIDDNGNDVARMYIKHAISDSPTDVPIFSVENGKKIIIKNPQDSMDYDFWSFDKSYKDVEFGEVRWNAKSNKYEMWLPSKPLGDHVNTYFHKFSSKDGTEWKRETTETNNPYGGPYYEVNNLGVSGDENGWITDRYLLSFGGPSKGLKKGPSDFKLTGSKNYASQPWAMWEMIVGGSQTSQVRIPWGYELLDKADISTHIEYITGDFDGDGLTDLAAVDKKNNKCFIRSSKTGKRGIPNIKWGAPIKNMTINHIIVTGDYDGDGKTDIGVVDSKGRWTVISSGTGELMHSPTNSNEIWDNWHWDKMTYSHTVISGDYDGDGKTDRAIVNKSKGTWWIISSRTGKALQPDKENDIKTPDGKKIWEWKFPHWDKNNSRILVGDYDNDGITDIGMVNVSSKKWYVYSSQTGKGQKGLADGEEYWGLNWSSLDKLSQSSIITMGDYNGDGAADRGFVNWNEGKWYHEGLNPLKLMKQLNGWDNMEDKMASAPYHKILEGDYNGDGATDHAFVDKNNHKVYIHSSGKPLSRVEVDIVHVYSFPNKKYLAKNSTAEGDVEMNITPVNSAARISVNGSKLVIQDAKVGDKISIMDAQGRIVRNTVATGSEMDMHLPSSGMYIVRVGSKVHRISIK